MRFDSYLAAVRAFTRDRLRAVEHLVDDTGKLPEDVVDEMRELGLFAITLPEEHGGLGWTMAQQVALTFEFTQTLGVFRARLASTIGPSAHMLLAHGSAGQQRRYLPAMAQGRCTGCAAVSEPGAGSDAGAVTSTARRDGGHWVLNGTKRFIANASVADVLFVLARTDQGTPGGPGTSMFLVPADTPGLHITPAPAEELFSWRGTEICAITLTDVRVPASAMVGAQGNGLAVALSGFNHTRTTLAATAVGQATRLLDEALAHATSRRQFGRPLADFQLVAGMLADMQTELLAGRSLVLDTARQVDTGPAPVTQIAAAKYFCTEMAGRVADHALQILGGDGIVGNHIVTRLYRDVRLLRIGDGASQVLQDQIARRMTRQAVSG